MQHRLLTFAPVKPRTFFTMKAASVLLAMVFPAVSGMAQTVPDSTLTLPEDAVSRPDTAAFRVKPGRFAAVIDRISSSRLYRMTYIGVPLVAGGLIVKGEDTHFRNLRNNYMPDFNRHADDYLQFAPLAVMGALKLSGVESRSSWGRMAVSDAASALIMGGIVNTMKTATKVTRPDGSNNHSFPSGHTATAFMFATMLNKEYGHVSPWIGIGGYAAATATGLMRMANNKHWLSDVLTGAGIGILATETGYWLADAVLGDKGVKPVEGRESLDRMQKPSFFSLYVGMNVPLSHYDLDDETPFRTSSGSSAGLEGAWFFNPYVGVGGRFTVSTTAIIVNGSHAEANTFNAISLCGGSYFSCPLSSRWLVGSKILVGSVRYPSLTLTEKTVSENHGLCFGGGVSLTFRAKAHYGMRFFLDYNLLPSHSRDSKEYMNTLVLGSAFMVTL